MGTRKTPNARLSQLVPADSADGRGGMHTGSSDGGGGGGRRRVGQNGVHGGGGSSDGRQPPVAKSQSVGELPLCVGHHCDHIFNLEFKQEVTDRRSAGGGSGALSLDSRDFASNNVSSYSVYRKIIISAGEDK